MLLRRLNGTFGRFPAKPTLTASGSRTGVMTGTSYKSFPGMVKRSGRLHLVYRTGDAHNSGGVDSTVSYKYSDDNGATWSNPGSSITLVSGSGSNDVRDPCILASSSGRLIAAYDTRNPYNSSNLVPYTFHSDDGGITWSSPVAVAGVSPTGDAFSTSQPIQMANGDIWLPGTVVVSGVETAVIWKSTDDGATFPTQVTIASGGRDYQETQIRLLQSGHIVGLLRSESNHHTWRTVSTDGGSTWSTPADVNAMTGRPDFVEFAYGALVQFGRYNTTGDSPGYWAISYDEGLTWTTPAEIDSGGTALWMYGAPIIDGSTLRIVYSLENSSSDADLYLRNYTIA